MLLGEWIIREEKKVVKGCIEIPEFSFGELADLQVHYLYKFYFVEYVKRM